MSIAIENSQANLKTNTTTIKKQENKISTPIDDKKELSKRTIWALGIGATALSAAVIGGIYYATRGKVKTPVDINNNEALNGIKKIALPNNTFKNSGLIKDGKVVVDGKPYNGVITTEKHFNNYILTYENGLLKESKIMFNKNLKSNKIYNYDANGKLSKVTEQVGNKLTEIEHDAETGKIIKLTKTASYNEGPHYVTRINEYNPGNGIMIKETKTGEITLPNYTTYYDKTVNEYDSITGKILKETTYQHNDENIILGQTEYNAKTGNKMRYIEGDNKGSVILEELFDANTGKYTSRKKFNHIGELEYECSYNSKTGFPIESSELKYAIDYEKSEPIKITRTKYNPENGNKLNVNIKEKIDKHPLEETKEMYDANTGKKVHCANYENGKISSESFYESTTGNKLKHIFYKEDKSIESITNYKYDKTSGKLTHIITTDENSDVVKSLKEFHYNPATGNITKEVTYSGNKDKLKQLIKFDEKGRYLECINYKEDGKTIKSIRKWNHEEYSCIEYEADGKTIIETIY